MWMHTLAIKYAGKEITMMLEHIMTHNCGNIRTKRRLWKKTVHWRTKRILHFFTATIIFSDITLIKCNTNRSSLHSCSPLQVLFGFVSVLVIEVLQFVVELTISFVDVINGRIGIKHAPTMALITFRHSKAKQPLDQWHKSHENTTTYCFLTSSDNRSMALDVG